MSNRNSGKNPGHRKPKVSLAMEIIQGLGEPKVNPNGLAEGQSVNIPIPQFFSMGAQFSNLSELLDSRSLLKFMQE